MDALIYGAIGAGLVVVLLVAWKRPGWLKYALAGFGILAAAGAAKLMLDRQRRLRELGVGMETAGRVALLLSKAEEVQKAASTVEAEAARDKELKRLQKELVAELKTARKEGADVEAIRAEIKHVWPAF